MLTIWAKGGAPSGQIWPNNTTALSTSRMMINILFAVGIYFVLFVFVNPFNLAEKIPPDLWNLLAFYFYVVIQPVTPPSKE